MKLIAIYKDKIAKHEKINLMSVVRNDYHLFTVLNTIAVVLSLGGEGFTEGFLRVHGLENGLTQFKKKILT